MRCYHVQLDGLIEDAGLDICQTEHFQCCTVEHFNLFGLLLHDYVRISGPVLIEVSHAALHVVLLAHLDE